MLCYMQAMPPVPRRGPPSKAASLEDQRPPQDPKRVLYARLEQPRATEREQPPPRTARPPHGTSGNPEDMCRPGVPHRANANVNAGVTNTDGSLPGIVYTELSLMDCRSRSLPLLDEAAAANSSYRLSTPSPPCSTGPAVHFPDHQPRRAGYTRSLLDQRDMDPGPAGRAVPSSQSLEKLEQLYHLAGRPSDRHGSGGSGSGGAGGSGGHGMAKVDDRTQEDYATYAEVPAEPVPRRHLQDNTYEQIPEHKAQAWAEDRRTLGNTYESLEDLRTKQPNAASAAKVSV